MQTPWTLPNIVELAVPFFIASMILEIIIGRLKGSARYETHDTAASLAMGLGNLVSGLTLGLISLAVLFGAWEFRFFEVPWHWASLVLCFVLDDLRYYVYHRTAHECRWFWADHVVHHTSQHYNLSTALRQTWLSPLLGSFIFSIPLVLLGFHPLMLLFVSSVNLVYQYWIHTEAIRKMPAWFEYLFNTPSHHRVHHATNPKYLDSNYAGTLMIWDRMFGTFVPEDEAEPCRYGVVKNIHTFNPLRIATHEALSMLQDVSQPGINWRSRLAYMVKSPGWSHDGSRQTSNDIKRDYVQQHPEQAGQPGLPTRSEAGLNPNS